MILKSGDGSEKKEDFLLEIGSDEIPAGLLTSAIGNLRDRARESLSAQGLSFQDLKAFGAPRRLVLYVENLSLKSPGKEEKVRGPSRKVAFDSEGNPTKALLGFCRSLGIGPEEVTVEKASNGEYVYGIRREPGKDASEILPEVLPDVVMGMECPRPLRWGEENFRWYRPIRWVVCLLGEKVISVEIGGVKAGRTSSGHRTLSPGTLEIVSAQSYFDQIEKAGVVVDQEKRKEIIWQAAEKLAKGLGGSPLDDPDLLEEVSNLAEHPAPFLGKYNTSYLGLPKEVLVTVMRHHQRYFPVLDGEGNVLPGFVGVRDGHPEIGMETVKSGNQVVLRARLEDASFFYERDKEERLEDRMEGLKGIYFLRNAGTLFDKVSRLGQMEGYFSDASGIFGESRDLLGQAVRLSKCDLLTLMVREFPELEGIMGGHYAKEEGLKPRVYKALAQQYLPRGAKDKLPDVGVSAALALMDKMDTLSMAFCLGFRPTGSQDPIGLRRLAQGVVSIIEAYDLPLDLESAVSFAMSLSGAFLKKECSTAEKDLLSFLMGRVEVLLSDRGYSLEMVRAVLSGKEKRIARLPKMVKALSTCAGLADIVVGWRRTSILAKSATGSKVQESLLTEEPEIRLYEEVMTKKESADGFFEKAEYGQYLNVLRSLKGPIDQCLDNVLIMAQDPLVKENRLNLLSLTSGLFTRYGDFALILPILGEGK